MITKNFQKNESKIQDLFNSSENKDSKNKSDKHEDNESSSMPEERYEKVKVDRQDMTGDILDCEKYNNVSKTTNPIWSNRSYELKPSDTNENVADESSNVKKKEPETVLNRTSITGSTLKLNVPTYTSCIFSDPVSTNKRINENHSRKVQMKRNYDADKKSQNDGDMDTYLDKDEHSTTPSSCPNINIRSPDLNTTSTKTENSGDKVTISAHDVSNVIKEEASPDTYDLRTVFDDEEERTLNINGSNNTDTDVLSIGRPHEYTNLMLKEPKPSNMVKST